MIRLFTRDQNYYRKEYDAAWLAQLLLNFRHHYQHKHYQLVRVKFFLGAIAHLSYAEDLCFQVYENYPRMQVYPP
jgi:hypothetical protein